MQHKDGGKNENYRTCNNARWNGNPVRRLVRQKYRTVSGFIWNGYCSISNSAAYRKKLIEGGETFRISISQNKYTDYSNDNVQADFEALKNGTKSLEDLASHFWDGEKDMWYLGMDVEYKGW